MMLQDLHLQQHTIGAKHHGGSKQVYVRLQIVETSLKYLHINAVEGEITERVTELDKAILAPELEEPGTTPEPEEPSMVDIDD
ncbi:hypothetical protein GGH14_003698 [Coemansia sp. RSA 370]|nr:hypothetical protein GGH14_003698 [Coemansia sp. RSA 370]